MFLRRPAACRRTSVRRLEPTWLHFPGCRAHCLPCGPRRYCHDKNILHRDIKSSNLLVNSKGHLKIADFGLARKWKEDSAHTNKVITLWYRPPELLLGASVYGREVDVWSAGCILGELFVRRPPFRASNEIDQVSPVTIVSQPRLRRAFASPQPAPGRTPCRAAPPPPARKSPLPRGATSTPPRTVHVCATPHHQPLFLAALTHSFAHRRQLDAISRVCGTPSLTNWPGIKEMPLYQSMRPKKLHERCLKQHFAAHKMPEDALQLLDVMLTLDPKNRITTAAALGHPFLARTATAPGPGDGSLFANLPSHQGE